MARAATTQPSEVEAALANSYAYLPFGSRPCASLEDRRAAAQRAPPRTVSYALLQGNAGKPAGLPYRSWGYKIRLIKPRCIV